MVNKNRVKQLNKIGYQGGKVVYWLSRDQRLNDNWALLYAIETAQKHHQQLMVVFCLQPEFLEAGFRQYDFMLKGLKQLEKALLSKNIEFLILFGPPEKVLNKFIVKSKAGFLITDFDPLKIKRRWLSRVKKDLKIPFHQVDAHNIVPCWLASDKQEYAAYTIRPKINKKLKIYFKDFPRTEKMKKNPKPIFKNNWDKIYKSLKVDKKAGPVDWLRPGERAAKKTMADFLENKLPLYHRLKNDPNAKVVSELSPYLHFGQISSQRVALAVQKIKAPSPVKKAFLEELIIRKELSDNFCYYNKNYDTPKAFPDWAVKTLKKHLKDKREYLYSRSRLERGLTHDLLWNSAQLELIRFGKMHGYLRMYWAKKILEWSKDYRQAQKITIYLNDKYELDGCDPNGYSGIAWAIGGVHDRPWPERKIFGTVRYMNYAGCKRKFDVDRYIEKFIV